MSPERLKFLRELIESAIEETRRGGCNMKKCTNRSKETFVDHYDGQEYKIAPGQTMFWKDEIANHFFGDTKLLTPFTNSTSSVSLSAW